MKIAIKERINAFVQMGHLLELILNGATDQISASYRLPCANIEKCIETYSSANPWFTKYSVRKALEGIVFMLRDEAVLTNWRMRYPLHPKKYKTIGLIMAGNIPAVGFHDFLCVLLSGHQMLAKLSSDDALLLPAIAELLIAIEPELKDEIVFTQGTIKEADAFIATGSNNTSRYFDYYFGKYPHIIRKNRNAVAVLNGTENEGQIKALGHDIFDFYGLGCRNVSKIYVPHKDAVLKILPHFEAFACVAQHYKYMNNYDYRKSVFLVNKVEHLDTGFLLVKVDEVISSPIAVLNYEIYSDIDSLNKQLSYRKQELQCVLSENPRIHHAIPLGESQRPALDDYADGVDTLAFLMGI